MKIPNKIRKFIRTINIKYEGWALRREQKRITKDMLGRLNEAGVDHKFAEILIKNTLTLLSHTWKSQKKLRPLLLSLTESYIKDISKLRDIVSLQPMNGPVALAYSLKYKYRGTDSAFRPQPITLEDTASQSEDTASQSEFSPPRLTFGVVQTAIEAGTRKLNACISIEAMQDWQQDWQQGIDIEKEIARSVAFEISYEVVNEIVNDLIKLAKKNDVITSSSKDNNIFALNIGASHIASCTKRGAGNFIICTPKTATKFEIDGTDAPYTVGPLQYIGNVKHVPYKLFICDSSVLEENQVLIGYKGGSDADAGYIYAPYISVASAGVLVDTKTYSPKINFFTRYGKVVNTEAKETPMELSQNYYRLVELK